MSFDRYTNVLRNFLQTEVSFRCENKTLKTGILKLFMVKQYFIRFNIETKDKEVKILELPYPFDIGYDGRVCSFNYHISCLTNKQEPITTDILKTRNDESQRLFNNIVVIAPLK